MTPTLTILEGDCLTKLRELPDESVHCCVTSPPYWGLRDYGVDGQIGLEATPEEYVAKMVEVFREVRRALRSDGTCWVNLGDSYARDFAKGGSGPNGKHDYIPAYGEARKHMSETHGSSDGFVGRGDRAAVRVSGANLKPKDLCGIPWRVAFALQADGWWLRQDIIWEKPNPMPESVRDRCTKSHEYIFLLSKSGNYFYDAEAIKERSIDPESLRPEGRNPRGKDKYAKAFLDEHENGFARTRAGFDKLEGARYPTRNKRTVWTVPSAPYKEAHFATFPPDLIKPCILAGTSARGCCPKCGAPWGRIVERVKGTPESFNGSDFRNGKKAISANAMAAVGQQERTAAVRTLDWKPSCNCVPIDDTPNPIPCTVLDPFLGSGTTAQVSLELGRSAIGIELNPAYISLGLSRTNITPGLPLA